MKLIGYPYVWAGTSELPQAPTGKNVPGGFDCSGFVWRVFKLQDYAGRRVARRHAPGPHGGRDGRRGRPREADPVREAPAGRHHVLRNVGSLTKAASVDHAGIYLGNGWMIHSSRYGVALAPVTSGWYRDRFAWGRRPLAEAGLS